MLESLREYKPVLPTNVVTNVAYNIFLRFAQLEIDTGEHDLFIFTVACAAS